ncbi:cysteine hydrolase family protein [Lichenifustis flavocetrariae]|uniref:Cysteine hydrolase n=1 Tax=Lichenifustis flavocetrariae TaxID=2949735 RepID=A0AA42CPF8_9HYPH|nr:isochorismatase family cysteine hydrolase [Lichenifustis flavocetrariae]MCW6510382.1 cysteine hydrolase [Lichenifustis flavocetrariae]
MAVTALDPTTALIVIDLQNGIVSLPVAHPVEDIVRRAAELAKAFRHHALPVVLVNVIGVPPGRTEQSRFRGAFPIGFAEFVPELPPQAGDHVVSKKTAGAFTKTDLEAYLTSKGATQVVIVGVATSMGVESTARQAHELGFNVTLVVDAMTDMDSGLHDVTIAKVFPRIGETGTTADILDLLNQRSA